jgi:hypothetical protein
MPWSTLRCLAAMPQAQRTQFVTRLVKGAKRAVLLTGTPLLSRPIEAWPQVDMLRPGLLGSYHEYGQTWVANCWAAGLLGCTAARLHGCDCWRCMMQQGSLEPGALQCTD